uniref:hypothetical protein n=1 Tax=Cutleria multifida TaxID=74475 RepID=UPI002E785749|nr:hypothetical protein V2479_pgp018 [Cutleria multifida]WAM62678.1 hypothetical protein [Cutleria multifida]
MVFELNQLPPLLLSFDPTALFGTPPPFDPSNFDTKDVLNLSLYFLKFLKQYYWALTLRLSIQWFPNINPYIHPMYSLIYATEFFLSQFEDFVPVILGMDMSSMCAFICLEWMIRTVEAIHFN